MHGGGVIAGVGSLLGPRKGISALDAPAFRGALLRAHRKRHSSTGSSVFGPIYQSLINHTLRRTDFNLLFN